MTENNKLYVKFEQRYMDRNFIPSYFDSIYEVQRLQYDPELDPMWTKARVLEELPGDGRYKGIYGELALEMLAFLELWGTFEDNQDVSNDGTIQLGLKFKKLGNARFGAQYRKDGIIDGDRDDMFTLDDRSLFLAYLAYKFNAMLDINVTWRRNWSLNLDTGEYDPVDSYSMGAGFGTNF